MIGAVKTFNAFDGEQVRTDAFYPGAHPAEHPAELLDIGFAGGIVDGGSTFCHHRCHDDIGSTGDGGFVEQHIATFQPVGMDFVDVTMLYLV